MIIYVDITWILQMLLESIPDLSLPYVVMDFGIICSSDLKEIEHPLQLFLKKFTRKLIPLVQKVGELLHGYFHRDTAYQIYIQTAHINWESNNIMQVGNHITYALFDQFLHLQKVTGYQDRDDVFEVHYGLFTNFLYLYWRFMGFLLVLDMFCRKPLMSYIFASVIDIFYEPIKDFDVAVYWNVDIITWSVVR